MMQRALLFVVLFGVTLAGVFQVNLTKIQSKKDRMIADGTWPAYLKNKEFLRRSSGNKAVVTEPIGDYGDAAHVVMGTLGTPPQQFIFVVDTGSANLWVPDITCQPSWYCGVGYYDGNKSSTYVNNGQQWFIQSNGVSTSIHLGFKVSGVLAQDIYCFGEIGSQQLCVPTTVFGRATSATGWGTVYGGVLGLAFQSIAVDNVVPPLINAINQHLLDQPIFTVFLYNKDQGSNAGGLLTYGGLDTTNCGPIIAYQSLSSTSYWQFRISGTTAAEAVSYTSSGIIGGPKSILDGIGLALGASYDAIGQHYSIDGQCHDLPDLVFTIGSNKYNIRYKNYSVTEKSCNHVGCTYFCVLKFTPIDSVGFGPAWILGTPFIRQYCNIYDIGQQRIGFAPSLVAM